MAMNIKKGDTIVVLSGKDKGKQGKVLGTVPKSTKIVAEGINMVTAVRARRAASSSARLPSPPARCRLSAPSATRVPALLTRSRATRRSACASTAVRNCKKGAR
jgi:ribosomal protein L24